MAMPRVSVGLAHAQTGLRYSRA